jgi:DNA-binding IscR family transcriptional regulator
MAEETSPLTQALGDMAPQGETVASLAARLPAFPPEAIEQALSMLADAGVLRREPGPDGALRYFYADPSRYKLADMDVVRRPDSQSGRPGRPR